ncbi:MAG: hypothetical protein IKF83_00765 [Clostridia bacterium]|nr:hypothetical protein [Clostridia bacterium]
MLSLSFTEIYISEEKAPADYASLRLRGLHFLINIINGYGDAFLPHPKRQQGISVSIKPVPIDRFPLY